MIPEVNPYNNYRGDGVATLFDYDFFIQNGSQLIVEHIDENDVVTRLEENIDYEIVVIEEEFAGYIKFPIEDSKFGILQENETLSLQLTLPFEQISEYGQSSLLDLNSLEFSLDYLTRLCQILKRQMERSVKVNEGSEANPTELLETINNNAIVSTNAAAIASKKADEAMESANIAANVSEEINNKIADFNESFEEMTEEINQDKENAKEEITNTTQTGTNELNAIKEEVIDLKNELAESGMYKFNLFDTKIADHILEGHEANGWALQGTWVYKEAIAGERFGYPDFYNKCVEEYTNAASTETVNGVTLNVYTNGHKFYDIADKSAIDSSFGSLGYAWYYGIDTENERIFLPRNNYLTSYVANGNKNVSVFGDGKVLGLTTDSQNGGAWHSPGYGIWGITENYGATLPKAQTSKTYITQNTMIGITKDSSKSGIKGNVSIQNTQNGMYLYICVGNTVSDTSWVDVVTQVEGGVKDLEDKTLEGIERLKASSDALTSTQITNCITEIPQKIKLELNNGVLTLKAGSVVIRPNGFEVDETTPKFKEVAIDVDYMANDTSKTGQYFISVAESSLVVGKVSDSTSGATSPSKGYSLYYNTISNTVYRYAGNTTTPVAENCSLPIAVVTMNSTGIASIDQIFNGRGYIGSTIWVDKGVKGLIPFSWNGDGTYKSNNIETAKILTINCNHTGRQHLRLSSDSLGMGGLIYDKERNINTVNGSFRGFAVAGTVTATNGVISDFQIKNTFRAVDFSDSPEVSGWAMPSNKYIDLTLGASNSTYTAPANGYLCLEKVSNAVGQFANIKCSKNGTHLYGSEQGATASGNFVRLLVPISIGTVATIAYNLGGATRYFRFIYAQGEV